MRTNQSILSYYPADDSKYTDPLYVPYQRVKVPIRGEGCYVEANTWKRHGSPMMVNYDHLRMDWGQDFLNTYPNDPCPFGWVKHGSDGLCTRAHTAGSEGNFSTPEYFHTLYQYYDGYSVDGRNENEVSRLTSMDPVDQFAQRSVNPNTGNYVEYFSSAPSKLKGRYNYNPTRLSYLGK